MKNFNSRGVFIFLLFTMLLAINNTVHSKELDNEPSFRIDKIQGMISATSRGAVLCEPIIVTFSNSICVNATDTIIFPGGIFETETFELIGVDDNGNPIIDELSITRIGVQKLICATNDTIFEVQYTFPETKVYEFNQIQNCTEEVVFDDVSFPDFCSDPKLSLDTIMNGCVTKYIRKLDIEVGYETVPFSNEFVEHILYSVIDTITVIDDTPPSFIDIPSNQTIDCGTFSENDFQALATDDCADVVIENILSSTTETNGNVVHTFLWIATDDCGNKTEATAIITETCNVPPVTDCDEVIIIPSTNKITVAKLESPIKNVKVYQVRNDGGWDLVARCTGTECQTTQEFTDLSTGTYIVEVQLFDAHWQEICSFRKFDLLVDGDGGNPLGDCSDITYQTGENSLTIENLSAPIVDLKVFNRHWQQVFDCSAGQCPETVILDDLEGGTHHILTKFYDLNINNGWEFVCRSTDEVMIPVNADSRNNALVNFDLYPNPAQELVTLDMWEYMDKQVDIRIYNAMSKEVYHQRIEKVTEDILTISLADFTNGMHFINIKAEGLPQVAKKLLVAKLY